MVSQIQQETTIIYQEALGLVPTQLQWQRLLAARPGC